jgi:excisionase family DNA binding protein
VDSRTDPIPVPEALWSVNQLAGFLGVSPSTVYEWRGRGKGPAAYRLGKHLRFAPTDVAVWLAAQKDPAPPHGGDAVSSGAARRGSEGGGGR